MSPVVGALILAPDGSEVGRVVYLWGEVGSSRDGARVTYEDAQGRECIGTIKGLEKRGLTFKNPLSYYQDETARRSDCGKHWRWKVWRMLPPKGR